VTFDLGANDDLESRPTKSSPSVLNEASDFSQLVLASRPQSTPRHRINENRLRLSSSDEKPRPRSAYQYRDLSLTRRSSDLYEERLRFESDDDISDEDKENIVLGVSQFFVPYRKYVLIGRREQITPYPGRIPCTPPDCMVSDDAWTPENMPTLHQDFTRLKLLEDSVSSPTDAMLAQRKRRPSNANPSPDRYLHILTPCPKRVTDNMKRVLKYQAPEETEDTW